MSQTNRQNAERVPVTLRGANVLTGFRDALFDASNRAGITPNEFALVAIGEKLVRSGRRVNGVFEVGDIDEVRL